MKMSFKTALFLSFTAGVLFAAEPPPGVPEAISYQGVLRHGSESQPVGAGSYETTIRIYDAAREGNALWGRKQNVTVSGEKGFFNVILKDAAEGSDDALPGLTNSLKQVFASVGSANRWISFSLDGKELLPRQQFTTTPFAVSAANAYGSAGDFSLSGNLSVGHHWDGTPDSGGTQASRLEIDGGLRVVKQFENMEGSNSVVCVRGNLTGGSDLVTRGPAVFNKDLALTGDAVFLSPVKANQVSASNLVVRAAFAPRETQCFTGLYCYYAANYKREIWNPDKKKNEDEPLYRNDASRKYWMNDSRRRLTMVSNDSKGEPFNAACWEPEGLRFGPYSGDSFLIFCFYIGTRKSGDAYYDGIVDFTTTYANSESTTQTIRCGNDPGLFKTVSIPVPAGATVAVRYRYDKDADAQNTDKPGHIDLSSVWWVGFGGEDASRYANGDLLPPNLPPQAVDYSEEALSSASITFANPAATNSVFSVYGTRDDAGPMVPARFTQQSLVLASDGTPIAANQILINGKLMQGDDVLWETNRLAVATNPNGLANIVLESQALLREFQKVNAAGDQRVLGGDAWVWRTVEIAGNPAAGAPEIRQELTSAPYAFAAGYAPAALTDFTVAGDMSVTGFAALGGLNATEAGEIKGDVIVEGGVQTKGALRSEGPGFTLEGRAWFGDGLTVTNGTVAISGSLQSTNTLETATLALPEKSLLLLEDGGAASFWTASGALAASDDEGGWFKIERSAIASDDGKTFDQDGFLLVYAHAAGRKRSELKLTSPIKGAEPAYLYFSNLHGDAVASNANLIPVPKGWNIKLDKIEGTEAEYSFLWLPLKRR